jgi:hypothetical protein
MQKTGASACAVSLSPLGQRGVLTRSAGCSETRHGLVLRHHLPSQGTHSLTHSFTHAHFCRATPKRPPRLTAVAASPAGGDTVQAIHGFSAWCQGAAGKARQLQLASKQETLKHRLRFLESSDGRELVHPDERVKAPL